MGRFMQQEEQADVSRVELTVDAPALNTTLTSVNGREKERKKLFRDITSLANSVVCFPTAG